MYVQAGLAHIHLSHTVKYCTANFVSILMCESQGGKPNEVQMGTYILKDESKNSSWEMSFWPFCMPSFAFSRFGNLLLLLLVLALGWYGCEKWRCRGPTLNGQRQAPINWALHVHSSWVA